DPVSAPIIVNVDVHDPAIGVENPVSRERPIDLQADERNGEFDRDLLIDRAGDGSSVGPLHVAVGGDSHSHPQVADSRGAGDVDLVVVEKIVAVRDVDELRVPERAYGSVRLEDIVSERDVSVRNLSDDRFTWTNPKSK